MKVGTVMVKEGEDIIDMLVVLSDLKDILIAMLMGLYFVLNMDYLKQLLYTFKAIQKVLMNVGGGQCFSLVHVLRNRLLWETILLILVFS
uniref:Uncharacterized protein n=1 Tax=Stegastes partitus TaxID=144197 RepID=A0A3B5ALB5_9TELE